MYTITKRMEIAGSHSLDLDYESPCERVHGHNWIITVEVESETLDANGMIVDFSKIKKVVMWLDHQNINDVIKPTNPTAENIAAWIAKEIQINMSDLYVGNPHHNPLISKITVQESEGNIACYIP